MAVFLLECIEDEERQANFPSKEASLPILEKTASSTMVPFNWKSNLMLNNNITVLCRPFSFHIIAVYTEAYVHTKPVYWLM